MTKPRVTVFTAVDRAKQEILRDIKDGRVPADVKSFGDLHDHVDANEYGGLCEAPWFVEGREPSILSTADLVQEDVDKWLKAGRVDEFATTTSRLRVGDRVRAAGYAGSRQPWARVEAVALDVKQVVVRFEDDGETAVWTWGAAAKGRVHVVVMRPTELEGL